MTYDCEFCADSQTVLDAYERPAPCPMCAPSAAEQRAEWLAELAREGAA